MTRTVKENPPGSLRAARVADTERKIVAAATELFVADGYAATSLAAVARRAIVAERTVYVRFKTKAALLKRVVDVAIVGDDEPIDVAGRSWMQSSLTAPSLAERIATAAHGARQIMERAGPLFAVARQAEATETSIAKAAQRGREDTSEQIRLFWTRAAEDQLLTPRADVAWLADTAALLGAADTYLLMTRTLKWSLDDYERWLRTTWTRLSAIA